MDRSGRAIIGWIVDWVVARTRPLPERTTGETLTAAVVSALDARNEFENLTADRPPEFPTVTDGDFSEQRTYEAHRIADASKRGAALGFVLVGLIGLVGLTAIYPAIVLWILSVASRGDSLTLLPVTVAIATILSLVLAVLADRLIPGRAALLLIACVPLVVGLIASAS